MTMRVHGAAMALVLALTACSGGGETTGDAVEEPAPLELTPGSWAANDEQAAFADEDGNRLATFRCDAETGELMLETDGDFAEGARRAMLVRVGNFMHGIDPVEVRDEGDGPVKVARLPASGPITTALMGEPSPMTIETDGGEPVMLETDEALQGFVERCREADMPAESGE